MQFEGIMNTKKYLLLFLVFLIFISVCYADTSYNQSGGKQGYYFVDDSRFDSDLDPATVPITIKDISDPRKIPLIADLDNDGVKEIVVLNDRTVLIYQNKSLDLADTFTLEIAQDTRLSNMILYDIDNDNLTEIIVVAEQEEELHVLQYNRSELINQTPEDGIDLSHLNHSSTAIHAGEFMINCMEPEKCLMTYVYTQRNQNFGETGPNHIHASFFNSTNATNEITLFDLGNCNFCTPRMRNMVIADYDEDGNNEFIFAFYFFRYFALGRVYVFYVNIENDNTLTLEQHFYSETENKVLSCEESSQYSCDNIDGNNKWYTGNNPLEPIPENVFTSPLVFDADPTTQGLETIIAHQENWNDFKIKMYDKDGAFLDDYPEITDGQGMIISNLFIADIFPDSSRQDFCVMGQHFDVNFIQIVCGSEHDNFGLLNYETIEFFSNETFGLPYNISEDYGFMGMITHSSESDASYDNDEVITSWGTLSLFVDNSILSGCYLWGNCDLNREFANTKTDGAVIPVDYEGNSYNDWIMLTKTNLYYIDDGILNQPVNLFCGQSGSQTGTCTIHSYNPALGVTWKVNTSVEIIITPKDPENDLVSARAILYYGDDNEQDSGWSSNVSSGTEIPFDFTANKTITTGTIRLEIKDDVNQEVIYVQKTFTVSTYGIEYGDAITVYDEGEPTEEEIPEECDEDDDCPSGYVCVANECKLISKTPISSGLATIGGLLGMSNTVIWLVFMLVLAVGIWFHEGVAERNPNATLGVILIAEMMMLILGSYLKIIPVGIIISVTVITILILGLWLGRILTGANNGGV